MNEDKNMCCACIDLQLGVTLIGIYLIVVAAFDVKTIIDELAAPTNLIIFIVCTLPVLFAAYKFILYFKDMKSKEARQGLPLGCAMVALSCLLMGGWTAIGCIFLDLDLNSLLATLIVYGVSFLMWAYFFGVCKRFADS